MRIGVVSDTHNHLSNAARIVDLFNTARVDRVVVVHDPEDLAPELLAGCALALHGHDHWQSMERRDGALIFNPGECAGHMPGRNSVGVLDLTTLHAQILNF